MLMMTAKVDKRKIVITLAAVLAAIILLASFFSGPSEETVATAAVFSAATNEDRVQFLKDFGWDVTTSPIESGQVMIPKDDSDVFTRYNALQESQGFDLRKYAGKKVMRYVYEINNYPNATEPVHATLLVYKDKIIGGDITNTGPGGKVHGFSTNESKP